MRTGAVRNLERGALLVRGRVPGIVGWCAPGAVRDIVVRTGVEPTVRRCAPESGAAGGVHSVDTTRGSTRCTDRMPNTAR